MIKFLREVLISFGMIKGQKSADIEQLISNFKAKAIESKEPFWKAVAKNMEKSRRKSREVNLSRLGRVTEKEDVIVVPGKLLSEGELKHPVTVYALKYSLKAAKKIEEAKGSVQNIANVLKLKSIEKVKIIG